MSNKKRINRKERQLEEIAFLKKYGIKKYNHHVKGYYIAYDKITENIRFEIDPLQIDIDKFKKLWKKYKSTKGIEIKNCKNEQTKF